MKKLLFIILATLINLVAFSQEKIVEDSIIQKLNMIKNKERLIDFYINSTDNRIIKLEKDLKIFEEQMDSATGSEREEYAEYILVYKEDIKTLKEKKRKLIKNKKYLIKEIEKNRAGLTVQALFFYL